MTFVRIFLLAYALFTLPIQAQWQLTYEDDELIHNTENQQVLEKLEQLLRNNEGENPVIRYTFNPKVDNKLRWKHLNSKLPITKNSQYRTSSTVPKNSLLIDFENSEDNCPTHLIITDPTLPISEAGLQVSGSAKLTLSSEATLKIIDNNTDEKNLFAITYDEITGATGFLDLRKRYTANLSHNITIGLLHESSSDEAIKEMKKSLKNRDQYNSKGQSISSVSTEGKEIKDADVKTKKITKQIKTVNSTCLIELKPLTKKIIKKRD